MSENTIDNIIETKNVVTPNQFSLNYIYDLLLQNKIYCIIGIIILIVLGFYLYKTIYLKSNKINNKNNLEHMSDISDDFIIEKPKLKQKSKNKKKVIIKEDSSDSEPEHISTLDLTQSELNNINDSLN